MYAAACFPLWECWFLQNGSVDSATMSFDIEFFFFHFGKKRGRNQLSRRINLKPYKQSDSLEQFRKMLAHNGLA